MIKDKARHKKESCKTFAELVVAAHYGENEANLTQFRQRVVRQNFISETGLMETHEPLEWLPQVCSAMAREVREALQPLINNRPGIQENSSPIDGVRATGYSRNSSELPTCCRCGQRGHVRKGCRNPPIDPDSFQQWGNYNGPLMRGSRRQ